MKAHNRRQGFTLIELLTVIAIIGILAAIIIPTVSRVRESAKRAKCMSNVRQIGLSLVNSANQTRGQVFPSNTGTGSAWAWDVGISVVREITNQAGREVMYCPSSNMLTLNSIDDLYPYKRTADFAVTSYVLLIPGVKEIDPQYVNQRIQNSYTIKASTSSPTTELATSQRPLVVDAVISNLNDFLVVNGGLPGNVSNHMGTAEPLGAHTGYVDGHVKWRSFTKTGTEFERFFFRQSTGLTPTFWF